MKRLCYTLMLVAFMLPAWAQNNSSAQNFSMASNIDVFSTILKELEMNYVDSLDVKKTVRRGIDAMLQLLDPYTVYFSQDDMGDLKMMTTGKYGGMGSVIRQYQKDKVVIYEPYAGSPAAKAGLKVGDVLLQIDEHDLTAKSTQEVSDLLRGEPGTSFVLKVQRPGTEEPLTFKITRETIATPAIPYYGQVAPGIGYINFSGFTEGCATQMRRVVIEMRQQGVNKLIIDLRDNGGGLVNEAADIVNLFVPKGKLVARLKGKSKRVETEYTTQKEPLDLDIPVVVLVNGNSASASEILSGALQDYDRGVVMGSRTFGKGLVQTARDVPYNGSLKLTTAKYYIPSGRCVQEIDYSHRNAQGRAERIADSLTTVFYTEAGREVRDGGGIRPDVEVLTDTVANITAYLAADDVLLDFATEYCLKHPTIPPVEQFKLTDQDFEDFCEAIKKSEFTYDKQTESSLKHLKEIAKFEGYLKNAEAEFEALEKKLTHDLDFDLRENKEDVMLLLAGEIVKRYYYQAGGVQESLKYDKVAKEAIELLNDMDRYRALLTKKEEK